MTPIDRAKRGCPRKALQPPSNDDFPASGTADEQKQWLKKKNVPSWQYQKLYGPDGEEYNKHESSRESMVYNRKKLAEEFGSADNVIIVQCIVQCSAFYKLQN